VCGVRRLSIGHQNIGQKARRPQADEDNEPGERKRKV